MLYKFKSKATGDLIMLEPQGRQIVQIVGKTPGPKGILEWRDMPAMIKALQKAVTREEEARAQAQAEAQARGESVSGAKEGVSLRQRATPFIDMLRRAHAEEADVVWGV